MMQSSQKLKKMPLSMRGITKDKIHKTLFLASLFAIPLINFIVFWVFINISAIDFSFKVQQPDGSIVYSLSNFEALIKSISTKGSIFWIALKNTILYWFTSSILAYGLALFIGYFLFKKVRGHRIFKIAFYIPNLIAPTILVALFKQIIANNGFFGLMWGDPLTAPNLLSDERYAIWVCLFYTVFFGFGTSLLVVNGSMNQINKSVIEASVLDGVNFWQEFVYIVIPAIWPTIIANLLGSVAGLFMASGPILLLTGGNAKTTTISFWIYQQVYGIDGTGGGNMYYAAAIGLFFTVLAAPLTFMTRRLLRKIVPSNDQD